MVTRITQLYGIQYPIVQGGMVWCSGWRLASAVSEAGVDAIVAEGFEAGGHNGREESTTMVLLPMIRELTEFPLIASGGMACGRTMLAAFALGAEGIKIGSLFAASLESSAHQAYKQKILESKEGDTILALKKLMPVRLLRNKFTEEIRILEEGGATPEILQSHLGKGRAKKGMLEGDIDEGELEIGQVAASINQIKPAAQIIKDIITQYEQTKKLICNS